MGVTSVGMVTESMAETLLRRMQSRKKGLQDRAWESVLTGLAEEGEPAKETEKNRAGGEVGYQEALAP